MNLLPGQTLWRRLELHPGSVIDGDTLRLRDPDPEAWGAQLGRLRLSADGEVLLRLAALDAPESCYAAGPADLRHQPPAATGLTLALLAAELARWPGSGVMARLCAADRYGRALALVWPAALAPPSEADTEAALGRSLNARLLDAGACFPDFHDDLPQAWIARLAALAQSARLAGRGLWPLDRSASGVLLADRQALAERDLVLPRLFRRIAEFWRQQGDLPAVQVDACFREFLEQRERTVRGPAGGPAYPFAESVEICEGRCRLTRQVENFLYQSCRQDQKLT